MNNNKKMNTVFYEIESDNCKTLEGAINEAQEFKELFYHLAVTHNYHFLGMMGVIPINEARKLVTIIDDEIVLREDTSRYLNTSRYVIYFVMYVNDMENFTEDFDNYLFCRGIYTSVKTGYLGENYREKIFEIIYNREELFTLDWYDEDLDPFAYKFVEDVEDIHWKSGEEQRAFLGYYYGEPTDDNAEKTAV